MPISERAAEHARKTLAKRRKARQQVQIEQVQDECIRHIRLVYRTIEFRFGVDCSDPIIADEVQQHLRHGYHTSELGIHPGRTCTLTETAELCIIDLVGAMCGTDCDGFWCSLLFASKNLYREVVGLLPWLLEQVKQQVIPRMLYAFFPDPESMQQCQYAVCVNGNVRVMTLTLMDQNQFIASLSVPTNKSLKTC